MNQSSQRIWCYKCEGEVFINNNNIYGEKNQRQRQQQQIIDNDDHLCNSSDINRYAEKILISGNVNILNGFSSSSMSGSDINCNMAMNSNGDYDSSAEDEYDPEQSNFTNSNGLVGLQNIANTCYMNSALQALSNTPPLTGYFLDCGDIIEANYKIAPPNSSQRKTGLARSYHRLVKDMWLRHKRKDSKFGVYMTICNPMTI